MKKIISLSILILAFSWTEKQKEDAKKESNIMLPEPSEIAQNNSAKDDKNEG